MIGSWNDYESQWKEGLGITENRRTRRRGNIGAGETGRFF